MGEIVKLEENEIKLQEEFVNKLREFKRLEREIKEFEKNLKETAIDYMEKHELKELDSEVLKITYVNGFTRTAVDTDKLKAHELYDTYTKTTEVKPNVRITIK